MGTSQAHVVRELDASDMKAILARNYVGRLAYQRDGRIDVVPISYAYAERTLYGRTAPSGKSEFFDPAWTPVTFEVDEVDSLFHWRSVVVYGGLEVLSQEESYEEWMRALGLLRRLVPTTLRNADPAPERSRLFRIAVQEMSGRAMT
jgi:nitroimidazol reductase NimA-like FMN-containing flavoprotein (pyridoxamine 5'-phosphate oxidase superfamily)